MNFRILLMAVLVILGAVMANAEEKENVRLDNLLKVFDRDPANPHATIMLLQELKKQGKSGKEIVDRYFLTQKEPDYFRDYNWTIIRDYVDDIHAPQLKYIFEHQGEFIQNFSKDDVFQKLDNVLVDYLEKYYEKDLSDYHARISKIKELGYEHYDVISDYFYIRQLRADKKADDYFYKARKLFRYFPEDRDMIKEITAGALELVSDVSRLKVIQLWAGKTVESRTDFDAICNYALISQKCGYSDVARKYAGLARNLADRSDNPHFRERAMNLTRMLN